MDTESKTIHVTFGPNLFKKFTEFREGVRNLYIVPPFQNELALVMQDNGDVICYQVHFDADRQPLRISSKEVEKQIGAVLTEIERIPNGEDFGLDDFSYIYRTTEMEKEFFGNQPEIETLIEKIMNFPEMRELPTLEPWQTPVEKPSKQ